MKTRSWWWVLLYNFKKYCQTLRKIPRDWEIISYQGIYHSKNLEQHHQSTCRVTTSRTPKKCRLLASKRRATGEGNRSQSSSTIMNWSAISASTSTHSTARSPNPKSTHQLWQQVHLGARYKRIIQTALFYSSKVHRRFRWYWDEIRWTWRQM